ncbi:MAG: guanylate kinase [Deltaproteobacteria bacterium]|nr:guanylate kinase [Deltaproteobacteria bacterium]
MPKDNHANVFVISAPSGAGKTTLISKLLKEFPRLDFSISTTTRQPRQGETNGRDYHFVDKNQFKKEIDTGNFLEYASIHGNYYGTTLKSAQRVLKTGRDLLLDVDVQGCESIQEKWGEEPVYIFILPPSFAELKNRLLLRGTESTDTLKTRLTNAAKELAKYKLYNYLVINDDLELAYQELRAIYLASRYTTQYRKELAEKLLIDFHTQTTLQSQNRQLDLNDTT